jgi:hypothetical protein
MNFLSFETFITPKIIKIVFILGLAMIVLGTLIAIAVSLPVAGVFRGLLMPLLGMCGFSLLWRIYCELMLVFFDMRDRLEEIANRPRI